VHTSDVLIIGGGPAGSTCARRLVDAGAQVTVLDAATFPRDKVCAGWITPQVIATVGLDVDEYSRSRTFQPLRRFRVGFVDGRALETRGEAMVSAAIRRVEFDAYLLERCGARTVTGERVRSLERQGKRWLVNGEWLADVVVGAGGSNCPAARFLNGAGQWPSLIVARETEFRIDRADRAGCRIQSGMAEIYFFDDVQGYGWCVRKGDYMNIGLGRIGRRLTRETATAFAENISRSRALRIPAVEKWRGHSYLCGQGKMIRSAAGMLLVGDAAGLASARSGEGIGPAVESAAKAAAVIADGGGEYDGERLQQYDAWVRSRWPHSPFEAMVTGAVPGAISRHLARWLLRQRSFVERVVVQRWFLGAHDSSTRAA
jgi:flavin-dependent dehydrogenase